VGEGKKRDNRSAGNPICAILVRVRARRIGNRSTESINRGRERKAGTAATDLDLESTEGEEGEEKSRLEYEYIGN